MWCAKSSTHQQILPSDIKQQIEQSQQCEMSAEATYLLTEFCSQLLVVDD